MSYPFTGYWREAVNEVDVEDIHESESERHFAGEVVFQYDTTTSSQNRHIKSLIEGMTTNMRYYVIQTKDELPFKPGDEIKLYDGNIYSITETEDYLPDRYKKIVALNPNIRDRYKIKLLVLR